MAQIIDLDARKRPPESLRPLFKKYQKLPAPELCLDTQVVDLNRDSPRSHNGLRHVRDLSLAELQPLLDEFMGSLRTGNDLHMEENQLKSVPVYEAVNLPGLMLFPGLLPPSIQIALLDKLLHRDLSDPRHLTNLHLHYDLPYGSLPSKDSPDVLSSTSFFDMPTERLLVPKDPSVHRPITVKAMMDSKLRWATLGGQYDWTKKEYPSTQPPAFPPDLVRLLGGLFPEMKAQAAILNLYSPGDTLAMHRDVSEECDRGLVSISLGCEAIFMVANEDGTEVLPLHVRSGDAILMDGSSRFAWHGVPKILKGTCPEWLQPWPFLGDPDHVFRKRWKGWMANKRINLNVRQMRD